MRHETMGSKKWLQRAGLTTMLLATGVVGELLTPLLSEAVQPTVTFQVDSGTPVSIVITTSSTCTAAEVTLGYTHCYAIDTSKAATGTNAAGVTRTFNVRNAPNATARLRIADKAGADLFSLIGVHFIPAVTNWGSADANANETHVLTITKSVTLDSTTNVNNAGKYAFGMRAGGELRAGPDPNIATNITACAGKTTTGKCDTIGDIIDYPGKGTFSPTVVNANILNPAGSTTNTTPLRLNVGSPTSSPVSFDGLTEKTLGQVSPTYPSFICDTDGTGPGTVCKPTISQTMKVTVKGPDSLVLVNGVDMAGANCAVGISDQQQHQLELLANLVKFLEWLEKQRPQDTRLKAFVDKLEAFLATATRTNDPECPGASVIDLFFAVEAARDQIAFISDGAVPVEPAPDSTITIVKHTSFETSASFTFTISGPSPSTQTIPMGGANSESITVSVTPGTYSITEGSLYGWSLETSECTGEVDPSSVDVPPGGNITCTFFNVPLD